MASSQQVAGLVGYYLREGYPDSVSTACDILLQRSPGDAHLRFWKAFALQATGNISQVVTMFRLLVHFVCSCWQPCLLQVTGQATIALVPLS